MREPSEPKLVKILLAATILVFFAVYYRFFILKWVFVHDSIMFYGMVQYFIVSLANGSFPFWDPYMLTGTFFYPSIPLHGLLDPSYFLGIAAVKLFDVSPLAVYIYCRFFRFAVYVSGAYYLFYHVTKCRRSALIGAAMVLFSMMPTNCVAFGNVDIVFLAPYVLCLILKLLESPMGPRRHIYILGIFAITGYYMNFFIPSYFLFNLLVFLLSLPLLKSMDLRGFVKSFRYPKMLASYIAAILLMVLLAAPSLSVMLKDASGDGELFPVLRLLQKNNQQFKEIMASDIKTNSLSNKYTDQRGVFSSYGNLSQLIYADSYESAPFFAGAMGEVNHYVGMLPFIFALLGILYSGSRYVRFILFVMTVIFINMFSFSGMGAHFNAVQRVFNEIFPPLKMIEARQGLGGFFVLYICLLASLGFRVFFNDPERFRSKSQGLLIICISVLIIKIVLTYRFGVHRFVYSSPLDLVLVLELLVFAGMVYMNWKGMLDRRLFLFAVIFFIFLDFFLSSEWVTKYTTADSSYEYELAGAGSAKPGNEFDFFREALPAPPNVAFAESMLKTKGILTHQNNHAVFSTKRYYDLLTHVPVGNQLAISGAVLPIVRFFPEKAAVWIADRKEILKFYETADELSIFRNLFLEVPSQKAGVDAGDQDLKSYNSYPNVEALSYNNLIRFLISYYRANKIRLEDIRNSVAGMLSNDAYSIQVVGFSPNVVRMTVTNNVDGFILYNDGWSRYWKAFDGDRPITVYAANYNSKAVFLKAGAHDVRFVFDPVYYKIGLGLFCAGLFLALGAGCTLFIRLKRTQKSDSRI